MRSVELLRKHGWLSALDAELARALGRLSREDDDRVLLAVALASRQVREGHVCADLVRVAGRGVLDAEGRAVAGVRFPELERWMSALRASRLVSDGSERAPLVLDRSARLYLARYYEHESVLATRLRELAVPMPDVASGPALAHALVSLFGAVPVEPDWQRVAAMVAVLSRLCIVTGGPGTGKTSTVVKLLALLASASPKAPQSLLLAPTGKAAARLADSVRAAKGALSLAPEVCAAIPEEASTIHRALRPMFGDTTRFRHDRDNPLTADVIVVDEASMVDVALMRRLADAVPSHARLILLGDAHQLVSVEAGAVLGDICAEIQRTDFSSASSERALARFGEPLPRVVGGASSPLRDCIVRLEKSHRFDAESGIGGVALAINAGRVDEARALLAGRRHDVELLDLEGDALEAELSRHVVDGYAAYLRAGSPEAALTELERFRLLCAHRRGPRGVEAMNALAERALAEAGLLSSTSAGRNYSGRPVLVTENDYQLGLFNGDIGVLWPSAGGGLRAYFPDPGGGLRELSPARLPPCETVFAMSIHKSQGSEFDAVAIVLPDAASPLASRELLYTAVTRARRRASLFGSAAALDACVARQVQRATGLRDALWAGAS